MAKEGKKLTSVHVDSELWQDFKVMCVRNRFTFQKLAERSIHLFLTNEKYAKHLMNHKVEPREGKKLTSVHVDVYLWQEFKVMCVRNRFTFQKLAEKSIHLFLTNEKYAKHLMDHKVEPLDLDIK